MTPFFLTLIIFGIAGYVAWNLRPMNAKAAVNYLIGMCVVAAVVVFMLVWVVPTAFTKSQTQVGNNWLPIVGEASHAVGNLGLRTGLWGNTTNTTMDYYYQSNTPYTPPQQYQAPAVGGGYAPPPNYSGGVPAVNQPPVSYAPPVTVTAEMQVLFGYYTQLADAEKSGDRTKGRAVVQSILAMSPLDVQGLAAQDKLNQAETVLTTRTQFFGGVQHSFWADSSIQTQTRQMLAGGTYVVLNDGAKAWTSACDETATIQETSPGWLFGTTYSLPRCYLNQFGTAVAGAIFTVR
jgi:hypothetical protein